MSETGRWQQRVDVLIITAIQLEYDAVLKVETGAVPGSSWERNSDKNNLPFAVRNFITANHAGRPLRVAVTCAADMGDVAVANVALPLIDALHPQCIAMCGVCAGRPGKTALGDVVAAKKLFFHDSGKRIGKASPGKDYVRTVEQDLSTYQLRTDWTRALDAIMTKIDYADAAWLADRPIPLEWQELRVLAWVAANNGMSPSKEWIIEHCPQWEIVIEALWAERKLSGDTSGRLLADGTMTLTEDGRALLGRRLLKHRGDVPDLGPLGDVLPFKLHLGSFASGDQVIEDESIWSFISQSMRNTLGLDMEAAALGAIAHYQRAHKLTAIVMKGVMDFANHGRDDHFKDFAARASAECLIDFLRKHMQPEVVAGLDDILTDGTLSPPLTPSPAQLLDARFGIVPWHGGNRAILLDDLDEWAQSESHEVAVRLIHAEGGAGKTRLAIEWVRQSRERHDAAGFLVQKPPGDWFERVCMLGLRVIIVIDYAESRTDLGELLERVSDYQRQVGSKRRIRILLLARNAGDWWSGLRGRSAPLRSLLGEVVPQQLGAVAVLPAEREEVFFAAAMAFVALRRKDALSVAPQLVDPCFDRVLYLHMAALAAVEGKDTDAGSLIEVTLDHEEHFWLQGNTGAEVADNRREARQIIAAATLHGGLRSREQTRAVLVRLLRLRGDLSDRQSRLITRLHEIYALPGQESSYLPGLEPDLLGEGMVQRLVQPPTTGDRVVADWIDRVFVVNDAPDALRTGFTVLGRASTEGAGDFRTWLEKLLAVDLSTRALMALDAAKAVGRRTAFAVLGDVLAQHLNTDGTPALALALERAGIPTLTVSLQHVAEWVARTLHMAAASDESILALAEKARRANNLGMRLVKLGRPTEALLATQEAVEIRRKLSEHNPDAYLPDFASSLTNLGAMLHAVGRRAEALLTSQEAVEIRRKLSERNPDAYLPDLAMSLNNVGLRLSEVGRREEALSPSQEAVEKYRRLSERNPDAYLPGLAMSLQNWGARLGEAGWRNQSLSPSQEAVEIYRKLSEPNPDAHLPELASSLNNLGVRLGEVGAWKGALSLLLEASEMYRKLSECNADAYLPSFAMSLSNLGARLCEVGQVEEALQPSQEAVAIRRKLAERNPDAHLLDLAMSLSNLGIQLGEAGRWAEALQPSQEVVEMYRKLSERNPDAYLADLAMSLNNLGGMLSEVGRREEALFPLQEAVAMRRKLSECNSEAHLPDLARSLNTLSQCLSDGERPEEALLLAQEAVEKFRKLSNRNPQAYLPELAMSLNNLGVRLGQVGNGENALSPSQEAVEIFRKLSVYDPEVYLPELAMSLNNLGIQLGDVGSRKESLLPSQQAVEIYRKLSERNEAYLPALAMSLSNLGARLSEVERREEALLLLQEAEVIRRTLQERPPGPS